MTEATLIYPHQLFADHPALAPGRPVYLVEEPLLLNEFPTHRQKLLLHRLSMQAYAARLRAAGFTVHYLERTTLADSTSVFAMIAAADITHLHIVDTTDDWLEQRITTTAATLGIALTRYDSPLFLLTKADAIARYQQSGKHMARFYKQLRQDRSILLTEDGEPSGGAWSLDQENRKKLPRSVTPPPDPLFLTDVAIDAAQQWLDTLDGEHYGDAVVWLPWTHDAAAAWLDQFLSERLTGFGTYEDAISTNHLRLFHAALSPLLNIGLLTPQVVLDAALTYAATHPLPLNDIEGFVRQVLGWREFIRASYEAEGRTMRRKNFWRHTRPLPASFWTATTDIAPLDTVIARALRYGYTHHIERLMVLGNFMLLTETDPDAVYRWFMALYVDAYDWVMVPNVYGMSQFADGGSFATKPYISGSNYVKKMSDYPSGDWEVVWTALYWRFIATHRDTFAANHRLAMMPRLLDRLDPATRAEYDRRAAAYFTQ